MLKLSTVRALTSYQPQLDSAVPLSLSNNVNKPVNRTLVATNSSAGKIMFIVPKIYNNLIYNNHGTYIKWLLGGHVRSNVIRYV